MDQRLIRHPLGFLQVKKMPDRDALRSWYADTYYQAERGNYRRQYSSAEIAWFHIRTERVAAAVSLACAQSVTLDHGNFLDVGCGEGFAMDWFSRRGWAVTGLDFSSAGIEAMNPHLLDCVEIGDLEELLDSQIAGQNSYELIWLTNVLEHVREPVSLLSSLRKLKRPGGALLVTVPNDGSAWQEFLYSTSQIPERFWIAIPDHLSYFDAQSLCAIASNTGWTCARLMADFPVDWFLGNPESEYVSQRSKGPGAHQARIAIDTILAAQPVAAVIDFYTSMAAVGMGRQLTAILV